jgi:hypothetical protein
MESETLYKIVFAGMIRPDVDIRQVKNRMSMLFKVDIAAIEKVFQDSPTIIQRNLPYEKALKYKAALEQTGALCDMESEKQEPSESSNPSNMYEPPAVPFPEVTSSSQVQVNISHSGLNSLDTEAWKSLGIGTAITAVVVFFPFLSFVFRYINTLVHEIGHAIFGWLFGYPSIPAFDFSYGGGITMHQDRRIIIVIIVYILFALLFYLYRRNHLTLIILFLLLVFYSLAAFSSFHSLIILFMGHGTELIFGSIFLYRALSGSSILVASERPLYAFLGIFIFFIDIRFAYRLMTSAMFRADYGAAKGGGHWMDFSRIAHEFLHTKLSSVAAFFLLLCLITPVLTFLFFRYKEYIFDLFYRVLAPEPKG